MVEEVACALLDATRRMSLSGTNPRSSAAPVPPPYFRNNSSPGDSGPSLSSSTGSTGSGGWWGSAWGASNTELDDKTGSLPKYEGGNWFGGMTRRPRTYSESDGGRVKIDVMSWLGAPRSAEKAPIARKMSEPAGGVSHYRTRRPSTKDVEEAMAGGLNKADIYMPPF